MQYPVDRDILTELIVKGQCIRNYHQSVPIKRIAAYFKEKENTMFTKRMTIWILAASVLIAVLAGCQANATPAPLPSATDVPATSLPPTVTPEIPTPAPSPVIVAAPGEPIKIQDTSILIAYSGYRDIGYNPFGFSSNMALCFDITEESGRLDSIIPLAIQFLDAQGNIVPNYFTESGTNFKNVQYLVWYILADSTQGTFIVKFPSGEMIDLTPLVK